jgi:hypothetical protein
MIGEVVMRCLVGFALVLALVTSPLGVSAQGGQEAPAVELQVDKTGVEVVPSRPRTLDGYTLEEMQLRVKRAKIGLWSTAGATVVGGVIIGTWWSCEHRDEPADDAFFACPGALFSGVAIGFSGAVGMIVTGALLGARKRKLRELDEARHGRRLRAQWNAAQSRVVF